MSRLILVSNRLPVTVSVSPDGVHVSQSSGGLATGVSGPHRTSKGVWIGWTGHTGALSEEHRTQVDAQLAERRLVGVHLSATDVEEFYDGYCNRVLWPLFHYQLERLPLHCEDWPAYVRVNTALAEIVCSHYQPGDTIWVHDYQLMLLPRLLRERLPSARIGFFLHIPFPAAEVFRILPNREELLEGLLGADLIGFHTLSYARHFANSLTAVLGLTADVDSVQHKRRNVRFGAYPMGIDAEAFSRAAALPAVRENAVAMRKAAEGQALLLGIDRLDYTKGIPRRLLAFERLLQRDASLRGKVRLVQVAVPSRERVEAYEKFVREVHELVGRINGKYGTVGSTPVHYLHQSFNLEELTAMYCAADVMLVTPLRDGMNLVAKEFVASRIDNDGVLILSEFAGAAAELGEAVLVNPYDVDRIADAIDSALEMAPEERHLRVRALRERVSAVNVHAWAGGFLEALGLAPPSPATASAIPSTPAELQQVFEKLASAEELVLLLDYDGTLAPFVRRPELAEPSPHVLALLRSLAACPRTRVHLVSGRMKEQIDRWFGALPIGLHAEHCFWSRPRPGDAWTPAQDSSVEWMAKLRPILTQYTSRVPGSFIEEKSASLAWHYRMADSEYGPLQANELYLHLVQTFANVPVEVLHGDKVLEMRPHGVSKALVVQRVFRENGSAAAAPLACALGDDRTDEDMFAALPPGGIAIHVGPKTSRAPSRLPDVQSAHAFLSRLAAARGSSN